MKNHLKRMASCMATALALAGNTTSSLADEGMWLFTEPPRALLKERYGFEIKDAWLEHLQKSSVRISDGGSGEFVSEDGLVLTNHHVGSGTLQKISTKERDYFESGFYAATLSDEIKAPDLELNVLESIEDVTARVTAAVPASASNEDAAKARRAVFSAIEKESLEKTGLRSDVVTLYQGERYHLYRYKRYTDVRLVFAPEAQIGFYGGDPDNFEYPRFDLDICLFRAYENGQPAKVRHFLKWSASGAQEGDLVFVSGHPGHTNRSLTMAELEYIRDFQTPFYLARLFRGEVVLRTFGERDPENARRAAEDLFGIQNSRKARLGGQAGLLDPALIAAKRASESALREKISAHPEWRSALAAYDRIAAAQKEIAAIAPQVALLEEGAAWDSGLFGTARTLLRAAEERPKPDGERLREYNDAGRESLELELFSPEPVYKDLEIVKFTNSLTFLVEQLGSESPIVQKVLAGKSPGLRATELVQATRLEDVALRKKLYAGDSAAVQAAGDAMIEFARSVDVESRALRKLRDAQLEAKEQAHATLAKARFALEGTGSYPDATFTLRLAFGTVQGYEEGGKSVPAFTTFAGLYERAEGQKFRPPFHLPPAWLESRSKLDLSMPFNFVSTADIIGGNSGSPVVNRAGEFVGIIFDGNIQSLVLDFAYTDAQARAVSVDSRGIMEALKKVYRVDALVTELTTGKRPN